MSHYFYRCTSCRRDWSATEIEPEQYLCPACGKSEPRRPLEGVLHIEYEYAALKNSSAAGKLKSIRTGHMEDYPFLWPLASAQTASEAFAGVPCSLISEFASPQTMFGSWQIDGHDLRFMDDTRNLTGSFKDRASLLVVLKALQLGIGEISASSTGNAGTSLAGIGARLGVKTHIWVPSTIPRGKLLQLAAYGATIYLVNGDYDAAFDVGLKVARVRSWYCRNTAYNPLTIEGKKSAAYDMFADGMPNVIFVPTGDGVILSGLHKGFRDLSELGVIDKLPKLIAVQAEHSDALCRFMRDGVFDYQPAHTVADSICAGAPRNLYMAAQALRESEGDAISVSDDEILKAQQRAGRERGLLIEPAAAASLAGYLKLRARDTLFSDVRVMLMFTGHGLKDPASLEANLPPLKSHSSNEWLREFSIDLPQ